MRLLIFHGYLLHGTGSNVYNARLVAALARQGHEVDLLSQERRPEDLPFVDAVGGWEGGEPVVRVLREPVRVTAWRPEIGALLPVYVADRYEGIEARRFAECSDAEIGAYVAANVAAVRDVVARARPDAALANHLVMGPLVLARALGGRVPYAVKVHGSALEYTVKPDRARFLPAAIEGLEPARAVLVGSRHTAESLWEALGDLALPGRTRLGPPGVDVGEFRPRDRSRAADEVVALAAALRARPAAAVTGSSFDRDPVTAAAALERLDLRGGDPHVAFVGKLIVSKGADLLAAAWPLVLDAVPRARLVVVGFGAWRAALEDLLGALAAGDLAKACAIADAGRALEGGPRAPLRHLRAFLDSLAGARSERYLEAARTLADRVVLTGRLEHDELAPLLAACEAQVVPSTYPEAFGMVAAEAAASGVLPVSAAHSGLAEVTRTLAAAVPAQAAPWLSFEVGAGAVEQLAANLIAWLQAPPELRARTREALVRVARERYSWDGVARGVVAAARGELDHHAPVARSRARNLPHERIGSAPMRRRNGSRPGVRAAGAGVAVVAAASALAACGGSAAKNTDVIAGKQLFVKNCGACHTLARASTKGTAGPNLDEAFSQSLKDGFGRDGIRGLVAEQIAHPLANGKMPAGLVKGRDAQNVAAYVARSVARPGEDSGLLATAVKQAGGGKPAVESGGVLSIPTDPGGQLAYVTDQATAKPGRITIESKNAAPVPHDIVIDGKGNGQVVSGGGVSKFTANFAPGTYTFYCSVPGHREAVT
jgi:glycosyltransferase involved in cell wall biosynthesis/mono/diheme cytochrome c family protein